MCTCIYHNGFDNSGLDINNYVLILHFRPQLYTLYCSRILRAVALITPMQLLLCIPSPIGFRFI